MKRKLYKSLIEWKYDPDRDQWNRPPDQNNKALA